MENLTGRASLVNLDQVVLEGALRIDAWRVDQQLGELVRRSDGGGRVAWKPGLSAVWLR